MVIAPSNPLVSIAPVLAVPGLRDAVEARREDCVAVSPIIAGTAVKGPADRLLTELGHEASVVGVARLYAPLAARLVIDEADADLADAVDGRGHRGGRGPDHHVRPPRSGRTGAPGRLVTVELIAVEGIPEIHPGDDIAALIAAATRVRTGDVLVVTQKIVSKAENQLVAVDPDDPLAHKALVEEESVRVLRRRGDLVISETRHGFVCANAGIDLLQPG